MGAVGQAMCPANVGSVQSIANADFGLEGNVEARAKSALKAGAVVQEIAADVEADVYGACASIAKDLGVKKGKLKPKEGQSRVAAACTAAVQVIQKTRASIKVKGRVEAEPPRCRTSMEAMADCVADCEVDVDPGEVNVRCEGGELSGKCEGKCQGRCTVDGTAQCEGTCHGKCTGQCSGEVAGRCDGKCKGTCDGENVNGKCDGKCRGECDGKMKGDCGGQCQGKCNAECTMDVSGQCKGTCTGECSVEFKEPRCTGDVKAPKASASCQAECQAQLTAKVECTPGRVEMQGMAQADVEQVQKLVATLKKNLPTLLRVATSMKGRLETAVEATHDSLVAMKAAVEEAGSQSLAVAGCFVSSLQAQAKASASIKVSIEASANVSGEVAGSAG